MATIVLLSLCAACASTSVSAVNSSRASVKATPSLVGSPIAAGTGPAVCALNGTTYMFVFVKGYDGACWYRIWDSALLGWAGGWASLGGKLTSSPAAVSRGDGLLDVYVAGTNGAVYENYYNSAGWHTWGSIGGTVAPGTGPGASAWTGRDDVFVEGTNGALYQKTWSDSSGWSGWVNQGGHLTSSPAATSWAVGYIDVYVAGTDGAVYWNYWDGYSGSWLGWLSLGGKVAPGTGPAVCVYGAREDLFVEGTNGALYQVTSMSGRAWSSWTSRGGQLSASPTAATYTFNGAIDIEAFVRGTNGLIYQKEYYDGAWGGWLPGIQGPP